MKIDDKQALPSYPRPLPRLDLDAMPDDYELLEDEAAEALGYKTHTLRIWRSQRIGPAFIKISRRFVRYTVRDLKAFRALHRTRVETDQTKTSKPLPAKEMARLRNELFGEADAA